MEYFPLGDLDSYLQTSQQLPEADVQQVTFQVLEGLLFMHENGYSHRDLKPQVYSYNSTIILYLTLPRTF